jgi:manganese oxidase
MVTRREALATATVGGTLLLARAARANQVDRTGQGWTKSSSEGPVDTPPQPPGQPGRDYAPTVTPGGAPLPFKVVDGVKVFHLVAEELWHEFAPGLKARCLAT